MFLRTPGGPYGPLGVSFIVSVMASFVLRKCKFRDGWLVPDKGATAEEHGWVSLCAKLAPSMSAEAKRTLRIGATTGAFVGLLRQPDGRVTNFAVKRADLEGDIREMVRKDPTIPSRLVEAYLVERAEWDSRFIETAGT